MKKKKKKPSKRQVALVKALLDPKVKTLAEAGQIAGYADRKTTWEALQTKTIQDAIQAFHKSLYLGGIDDEKIVKRLGEALDAEETRFFQFQGNIVDQENVVDHATRLKAIELVVKIRGLIRSDKEPIAPAGPTVNINFYRDARTEDIRRDINAVLRGLSQGEHSAPGPIVGEVRQG